MFEVVLRGLGVLWSWEGGVVSEAVLGSLGIQWLC